MARYRLPDEVDPDEFARVACEEAETALDLTERFRIERPCARATLRHLDHPEYDTDAAYDRLFGNSLREALDRGAI